MNRKRMGSVQSDPIRFVWNDRIVQREAAFGNGDPIYSQYHPAPRCPTLTKIVHHSRLNGWCRLICGLRSQLPAG